MPAPAKLRGGDRSRPRPYGGSRTRTQPAAGRRSEPPEGKCPAPGPQGPARASTPSRGHSPAVAPGARSGPTRPRGRRRRRRHDVTGRGGAGRRRRRSASPAAWQRALWRRRRTRREGRGAAESGPALGHEPRGRRRAHEEAEQAIQCLNGKLALSKKLVVRWAHAQVKRYDHNKNDKILPISLEPSSSTEPTQSNLSVTAKIKAIEAKLKMMAENPDAEYPAAPVYSYFKPPDKKRTTPYSRTAWKSRR
uniref:RNA binding motif protein 18 n=1 Tax=Canis lupus familiaris TaxID=9615 RepID=A0A8C0RWE2_CANLF